MSPFSKLRTTVSRAGLSLCRALGSLLPGSSSVVPPERIELATRVRNVQPQPIPFLEAISSSPQPDLLCDPYPAAQLSSMAPPSSGKLNPSALQSLVGTLADREARRDAAEQILRFRKFEWRDGKWRKPSEGAEWVTREHLDRTGGAARILVQLGYRYEYADEARTVGKWVAPTPAVPTWLREKAEDTQRRVAASIILTGLGWRHIAGQWVEPPPVDPPARPTADTLKRVADALNMAVEDFTKPPLAEPKGESWRNLECGVCGHAITLTRLTKRAAIKCPECFGVVPVDQI